MKLLSLLFVLIISGCASFEEKYSCVDNFTVNGDKLKWCEYRGKKVYGLYSLKEKKFLLEPEFSQFHAFSGSGKIYVKKASDKYYTTLTYPELKEEKTKIINIGTAQKGFGKYNNRYFLGVYEDNTLAPLNDYSGTIGEKIENVHMNTIKNEFNYDLHFAYESLFRTYIIRKKIEDKYYYQLHNIFGKPLTEIIPADEVVFYLNDGYPMPFQIIDKKRSIVKPITSGFKKDFYEVNKIKGFIILENYRWYTYNWDTYPLIPSFSNFLIVYDDGKKEKFIESSFSLIEAKSSTKLVEFVQAFSMEGKDKTKFYTDIDKVLVSDSSERGTEYKQERIIATSNNKYYLASNDGHFYKSPENEFHSKKELLAFVENKNLESSSEAQNKKVSYDKKLQDGYKRDAETKEMLRKDVEDRRAAQADRKARERAKIKEASDKAWGGVSDQIKKAARESETRAKCINRVTQTKKDYLDKKQNWYETGGCD